MLTFVLALALGASDADACGDPNALKGLSGNDRCTRLHEISACLERVQSAPVEPESEWLLADGTFTSDAGVVDAGMPSLELNLETCAAYGAQPGVGGSWRERLLSECLRVTGEAGRRATAARDLEVLQRTAEREVARCDAAFLKAERTLELLAAPRPKPTPLPSGAVNPAFLKAHPEAPVQAISAVLCRVDAYRKWTKGQIDLALQVGGADNAVAAAQLGKLVHFLDDKRADAVKVLTDEFHGKPIACDKKPVKQLWPCVPEPVLLDEHDTQFVVDTPPVCELPAHADWYLPRSGWYLGPAWFQPGG